MSQWCRPCHGPSRRPLTVSHPYGLGEGSTQRQRQRHFIHSRTLPPQCYCLAPPRPTAQLWTDRPMTPKSAPLPPVLPPPLPGGPLQGLPCYGAHAQYMRTNKATRVACVISCLCARAFLERCLPGRAACVERRPGTATCVEVPSWKGNAHAKAASVHRTIFQSCIPPCCLHSPPPPPPT
jgi:hypothetical protein